ncbi:hypothetical protein BDR03DRAFT_1042837 [Suillus americanus]|nr:hypothetical protein BDR03DRAFT_1042837 [Suillus americanus]
MLPGGWYDTKILQQCSSSHRRSHDEEKSKDVWLKRHTDASSIIILWSQPTLRQQFSTPVKHYHDIPPQVINTSDMMTFFTGGYYKPMIHRVIQPSSDQRAYHHLGAYCFAMPDNDVRLLPFTEIPVLKCAGIERQCLDKDSPSCETWRMRRMKKYRRSDFKKGVERGVEEEVIEGIVVKHYN